MPLSPSCAPESFLELLKCVHAHFLRGCDQGKPGLRITRAERKDRRQKLSHRDLKQVLEMNGITFYRSRGSQENKIRQIQGKKKFQNE